MEKDISISFIIPLYNCANYIERCLQSILNQNIAEDKYEIIVVDDGSTDGSGDIVAEIQKSNPNIKLLCQANYGVSSARNKAIDNATGKYIYFVDADDLLFENSIGKQLRYMDQHDLDALRVVVIRTDEEHYLANLKSDDTDNDKIASQVFSGISYLHETNLLKNGDVCCATQYIYRRAVITENAIKLNDNVKIAEDYLYNIEAILFSKRVAISPIKTYLYINYPNSTCHAQREYEDVSEIGFNLLHAFKDVYGKYGLPQKGFGKVVSAYKDYVVFAYILWPMVRECVSLDMCKAIINRLKAEDAYPISKPSKIDATHMRYNMILNALWHISRYYPIWLLIIALQRIVRVNKRKTRLR
jgi:glycosyltransferase involved in cell wall biosynthesis